MNHDEINYLVRKANALGLQGKCVESFVLPTLATQSLKDTLWIVVDRSAYEISAASSPWWEHI